VQTLLNQSAEITLKLSEIVTRRIPITPMNAALAPVPATPSPIARTMISTMASLL